jgi:hypothetical protein
VQIGHKPKPPPSRDYAKLAQFLGLDPTGKPGKLK